MSMKKGGELIVGLDVGTTRTCVVVAEAYHTKGKDRGPHMIQDGDIGVDIVGFGLVPSRGTRKGVVVNIEEVVASIRDALREAEASSGVEIRAVYAGLKGRHIDYITSHGVIAIGGPEVTQEDVDRVIDSAKAVALPFDRSILHIVPTGFTINGQNGIHDPRGMEGVRLETGVRIITADAMSVHNLKKACEKAGVEVIDVVFEPIATAMVVLDEDEKDMGVALIDIGGGTTDIAVFLEGSLCHTSVLPIGGSNFTNDIAIGLRITTKDAEEIKKRYGASMLSLISETEEIEVGYSDSRHLRMLPRRHLIEVIQPRAEELLGLVMDDLAKSGYYGMLASGVVLTGGGALLGGIDIMAENMLELPVRTRSLTACRDMPESLNSPAFASSMGLVLYGARETLKVARTDNGGFLRGMISRLREWAGGLLGA